MSGRGGRGSGGRTAGRGGSQGRGSSRRQGRTNKHHASPKKWKGTTEELNDLGVIFDCSDHQQADVYERNVKRLSEFLGATMKNGGDVAICIDEEVRVTPPRPIQPDAPADPASLTPQESFDRKVYEKRIENYVKRLDLLDSNLQRAYHFVIGQCTELMETKLKQSTDFQDIKERQDVIGLLGLIRAIMHKIEDHHFPPLTYYRAMRSVFLLRQETDDHRAICDPRIERLPRISERAFAEMRLEVFRDVAHGLALLVTL